MKDLLNWESKEVVTIYDEVSLWAAPFALTLLEHIPMLASGLVLDIGFGTGFPLLELAQRYGNNTKIIGIDIWDEAIKRAKLKQETLGLSNIEILHCLAEKFDFKPGSFDLICSNLGINNLQNKWEMLKKVSLLLKPKGDLVFTTNDQRTFQELFVLFIDSMDELQLDCELFKESINRRSGYDEILERANEVNLKLCFYTENSMHLRFSSASALFDHGLIRIAFREAWERTIGKEFFDEVVEKVKDKITKHIQSRGEFKLTIPVQYYHFQKQLLNYDS